MASYFFIIQEISSLLLHDLLNFNDFEILKQISIHKMSADAKCTRKLLWLTFVRPESSSTIPQLARYQAAV